MKTFLLRKLAAAMATVVASTSAWAADVIIYSLTANTDPVAPGQIAEFVVTMQNTGFSTENVILEFTVPQYTSFGSQSAGSHAAAGPFSVPGQQTQSYPIRLNVLEGAQGPPGGATITLTLVDNRRGRSVSHSISVTSPTPTPTPTAAPTATPTGTPAATPTATPAATATATPTATPGVVGNVSTRLPVGADENVLIEGFIVQGPAGSAKKIIVRAIGPSLAAFGIADALQNPTLEIRDTNNTLIATNDNWKSTEVGGIIADDQSAEIAASQLAPSNDLESAIVANLTPGAYTAIVRGSGSTIGTGVVDAYDLNATSPAKLANIATRGLVQPGDKLMIAGFIIQNQPMRAVIRAIGPSLVAFGISNALADTTLQLRDQNGVIVRENDNWQTDQKQELEATGLQPSHDLEAALIETIQPGQYTAQVRGTANASGIGVVQVYFLQ